MSWRSGSARASIYRFTATQSGMSSGSSPHRSCFQWHAAKATQSLNQSSSSKRLPSEFLQASAEAIPLENESIDTVVTTWTLCSIPDVTGALAEVRRVLKRDGRLLFVEHGLSPDPRVSRWQNRLTPFWKHIGGGCHLNRPIAQLIEGTGFRVEHVTTGYMKGPKPMTFMYEGAARIS